MTNLNYKTNSFLLMFLITFFIIGCASEPVKVDLSATHPANPEAHEAQFVPPPNPFREDVSAMKMESTTDSTMKHKPHDEKNQKHMHHNDNQHQGHHK